MPDWNSTFPLTILDWPAAHGNTLPLAGDSATLVVDSRGIYRCVWWDGQMTFATQQSQAYYLTSTASDVASHNKMTSAPFTPKTTLPFTTITNQQELLDFMTEPGRPGVAFLPAGQSEFHIHAAQTAGNQIVQLYAEFWEYDPISGMHIAMIGQSQFSKPLTADEIEYRLFFTNLDVYTFVSTRSRIAVHLRALVGGTGGANINCFVGGESDSHAVIPVGNPLVPPTAWIAPTLLNSWTNIGGGYETTAYLKDGLGFVHLKGVISGGATATTAYVLPAGYRPGAKTFVSGTNNAGTSSSVQIDTVGNVLVVIASAGTAVGLSGITFLAEN
jgi:hypothetical protein